MKKRRLLSIVLSLCMVIALMPQMVFAETSGTTADGFSYTISDGEATITGYTGSNTEIEIPNTINGNPVTAIGNAAFMGKNSIESIEIPGSVTSIGKQAFYQCTSLSSVTFGKDSQLTSIGDTAFNNCHSLESITIPDGVTSIGYEVFAHCKSLASIDIPDGVTTIEGSAFASCSKLAKVTFGDNSKLASIGIQAFSNCASLESIEIPSSVTTIKVSAFAYCSSLESIEIPNSITSIEQATFRECRNLKSVTFGKDSQLTSIGGDAFYACTSLKSIEIPSSVTSVGSAFGSCTSLESIFLPKDLVVTNAAIPDETSQVKYSLDTDKSEVTITEISLGTDKAPVAIPDTICGYPVVAVESGYWELVGSHTCKGGTATCTAKALCSICGEEYGELDSSNHDLENIPAKDATVTETGNIEYWKCLDCGRLFADENGEKEISLEDTVIQKLTPGDKDQSTKADAEDSAKTGDDTNLALWLALMLLSGVGITGVTAYTRRKRTNE